MSHSPLLTLPKQGYSFQFWDLLSSKISCWQNTMHSTVLKPKWPGKPHGGNKGTKLFTLEETIATSQKQICEHINFLLITVRRLRDHVSVTIYFKCHPFIIHPSHRQQAFQNLQRLTPWTEHHQLWKSNYLPFQFTSSWAMVLPHSVAVYSNFFLPSTCYLPKIPITPLHAKTSVKRSMLWVLRTLVSLILLVTIVFPSL